MYTTIYFIRHAHSHFVFGKERERPLSEKGFLAAEHVVKYLENVKFDAIFSSPYTRAIQTVEGLSAPSKMMIAEGLRERELKGPYKMSAEEIEVAMQQSFNNIDYCLEGGESVRQAQERALPIILEILKNPKYQTVAVGTHGNIMTSIFHYFNTSIGYSFWKSTKKPDIHKLIFNDDQLISIENLSYEEG